MCPVGLYDGCEAKENPCCVKLERRRGGYSNWKRIVAGLKSPVPPLVVVNPPASSSPSFSNAMVEDIFAEEELEKEEEVEISPVCEWSVENGVEYYHDQLIGSRFLLYEGCKWIVW